MLPSLRYAFFGGDVLKRQDLLRLKALAPGVICVNFYGATETPQAMGYHVVSEATLNPTGDDWANSTEVIPIGRGIQDVQLLVLNSSRQLAGIGQVGEIYIRTPYLARGYLGDDALTEQRFIINPFTAQAGDRLYQTGDLARYLPNGEVQFLGRADHQVKIRGFRIELEEIEGLLVQHAEVQQAVVLAREDAHGDKQLVAYVVPDDEQSVTSRDLSHFLQERLPHYMVPAKYVKLNQLPLTPNGKVDRRALPAPEWETPERDLNPSTPRTPMEKLIAAVWQEALGTPQVGVYDNFFDLGGHSLLSVKVLSQLEKQTGLKINPAHMRLQTLGQLAATYEEYRQRQSPRVVTQSPESVTQKLLSVFKRAVSPRVQ
jgi:acyl-CoA synthetase (AMP-forming)/AMP-acid ligase II/acyl carrier protein